MTNGKKVWLTLLVSLTLLVTVGTVYALRIVLRAEQMVQTMHAPIKGREATVIEEVELLSLLLLGIANDSKRKTDYRANTIMIVTLNPKISGHPLQVFLVMLM
ncbi:Cell envelope-associatedtranscriptionalattenuator LytR-CpsA-Psr, subfamily F2 [Enterococcus sp. HSIEG1]|nr:Cell envelope-associatedtranscriptionalattenuator LytR-CpsA-Psr, subfamily F2 [Enterococcus sp. HSIEG1]